VIGLMATQLGTRIQRRHNRGRASAKKRVLPPTASRALQPRLYASPIVSCNPSSDLSVPARCFRASCAPKVPLWQPQILAITGNPSPHRAFLPPVVPFIAAQPPSLTWSAPPHPKATRSRAALRSDPDPPTPGPAWHRTAHRPGPTLAARPHRPEPSPAQYSDLCSATRF